LLRLFENIPDTRLNEIAFVYKKRFKVGNASNLPIDAFNPIFAAIVEHKGASIGRSIWDLFCGNKRHDWQKRVDRIVVRDSDPSKSDSNFTSTSKESPLKSAVHSSTMDVNMEGPLLNPKYSVSGQDKAASNADVTFDPGFVIGNFQDPGASTRQKDAAKLPNPIVVPNLKTVRIIVRKALGEQAEAVDLEQQKELTRVLKWSARRFKAMGLSDEQVEREFQVEGEQIRSRPSLKELILDTGNDDDFPVEEELEPVSIRKLFPKKKNPEQVDERSSGKAMWYNKVDSMYSI